MKKATQQQTKQHNRELVLRTILESEAISRAEVARVTKLTRTTVSDVVSGLITENLVAEIGHGVSMGGKSPILLSGVADSRYLIGLNLIQSKFVGAIVNLRGEIKDLVEVPVSEKNGQAEFELVCQIIGQLLEKPFRPIVGIGVGTAGLVNTSQGIVVNAVNLDWKDFPLGPLLRGKFGLPVSIMNDSQADAMGEFVYSGRYNNDENLIVVNIDQGIGSGIFLNGRLFQGDKGSAGEIGHVVVEENGKLCRCGRRGCLETVASVSAVLDQLNMRGMDEVETALRAGDPRTIQVVRRAGYYLGIALANLISILNIRKIALVGAMTRLDGIWLDDVRSSMSNATLELISTDTELIVGNLDYRACVLGASASLLLDSYSILFTQEDKSA